QHHSLHPRWSSRHAARQHSGRHYPRGDVYIRFTSTKTTHQYRPLQRTNNNQTNMITTIVLPKIIQFEKRPSGQLRPLLTGLQQPGHYLMVVDNSTLEVGTRCPTAYFYNCVLRREAFARNAALTFGGAIHKGIEALLRGADKSTQDDIVARYFAENPTPPDEYRTLAAALQILKHYRIRATFPDYEWDILNHQGAPGIERPFDIPSGTLSLNH